MFTNCLNMFNYVYFVHDVQSIIQKKEARILKQIYSLRYYKK